MKYKQGDILIDKNDGRRKILGTVGTAHMMSGLNQLNSAGLAFTEHQLDELGYKLEDPKCWVDITESNYKQYIGKMVWCKPSRISESAVYLVKFIWFEKTNTRKFFCLENGHLSKFESISLHDNNGVLAS